MPLEQGQVNAHTHLYSGLAPLGLPQPRTQPRNLLEILQGTWWRLDLALDADSLRAAARLYVAEALAAGTRTLVDHHESPRFIEGSLDILADVCQELGMRALICYGATERNFGHEEARRGLAECQRFLESNRRPLVRGAIGLHAAFTVSDATLREAGDLCRAQGAILHLHVAEDVLDVVDARRRGHSGVMQRLVATRALVPGSILAHGVHLTPQEVRQASELGCWLVQSPRSNRGNGVGYPTSLVASERVALGTDGYPADMAQELAALLELGQERGEPEATLRRRAAAGADLAREIWPRLAQPDEASALATTGAVAQDAQPPTDQMEEIREEAQIQAQRLWQRMKALP